MARRISPKSMKIELTNDEITTLFVLVENETARVVWAEDWNGKEDYQRRLNLLIKKLLRNDETP